MMKKIGIIAFLVGVLIAPPAYSQISISMSSGGALQLGTSTTTCDSAAEGGLRWSSAESTVEMCDGMQWKKIIGSSPTGDTSTPASGTGYFVLSSATWAGNFWMGNADSLCLTDLTNNDWMNKGDATTRELMYSSHIKAFLCNTDGTCQSPLAGTTYTFAVSGDNTKGGATFMTDGLSRGPGDSQDWSGATYFGSNVTYWTSRDLASATLWTTTSLGNACYHWTDDGTGGYGGLYGSSNATNSDRWTNGYSGCASTRHLICMVHP